ncbi:MAG: hypothetical protein HYV61_00080 [Candidatus Rokubacteria bacterium]|nr:hypothetical protein [Candidatus Rokubacteria bacterium]MBI2878973.1 hypothetical protein [Candidatus Rokubacteria bacterium]
MVHPIEIVVDKQEVGTVSGKMSIPAIYRMEGVIGAKPDGSLGVNLTVFGPSAWEFQLKVISEKKLEGTGRSPRHYGPVVLDRE